MNNNYSKKISILKEKLIEKGINLNDENETIELDVSFISFEEFNSIQKLARYLPIKIFSTGICSECGENFKRKYPRYDDTYKLCKKCAMKYGVIKKYGCEYYFQSDDFKEKSSTTLTKRYGNGKIITNPSQVKKFREKAEKTCEKLYGEKYYTKTDEYNKKLKETCLKNYGCEHFNQSNIVKEHKKETCLKKYGVTNPNKILDVREKIRKTCVKKFGKYWNVYKYYFDGNRFDSSWEMIFYIYLKDHNYNFKFHPTNEIKEYYVGDKKHFYEPDFLIDNKLYEIKGSHFFNEKGELIDVYNTGEVLKEKQKVMSDYNVIVLTEKDEFLKLAFSYFKSLKLKLKDFKKRGKNE